LTPFKETDGEGEFEFDQERVKGIWPSDGDPQPDPQPDASVVEVPDWPALKRMMPAFAGECLDAALSPSPDWSDLFNVHLVRVFQAIRNLAWSAAVHFGVSGAEMDAITKGADPGASNDWKLIRIQGLYNALGARSPLLTRDTAAETLGSRRYFFNCQVYLLRYLYASAGADRPSVFESDFDRILKLAAHQTGRLGDTVVTLSQALESLKGSRKVTRRDLSAEAFPRTLVLIRNAISHQQSTLQTFFVAPRWPKESFVRMCLPTLRLAIAEWLVASRLDTLALGVAIERREDGWLMGVDRGAERYMETVATGDLQITAGRSYVLTFDGETSSAAWPFVKPTFETPKR